MNFFAKHLKNSFDKLNIHLFSFVILLYKNASQHNKVSKIG